jgi:S1-C subfamily serine protease
VPLYIRILTGARTGQLEQFNDELIVVGRHPTSTLKFDIKVDIDVSSKHAEIRKEGDHWTIKDLNSTNGTFVNGNRIEQWAVALRDGDRVMFGKNGPTMEVHSAKAFTPAMPMPVVRRANTEERVALAVKKQTAGLRNLMIGLVVLLALGVGAAFYVGRSTAGKQADQMRQMLAANDSMMVQLQSQIASGGTGDTTLANEVQRQIGTFRAQLSAAKTDTARTRLSGEISRLESRLAGMVRMDLTSINKRNAPAVAILVSQIDGHNFAGTAFAIDSNGVLLTNRHNVRNQDGQEATKIAIKFVNTRDWLPAHIVKVSDASDVDLAILQMDVPGPYPTVAGIGSSDSTVTEGSTVAIIGFPLGYDTPQEGEGNNFIAKSSLNGGTVSKMTSAVEQIDSFAAHGSSGSPVIGSRGTVVGVVWGGQAEAGGRIVFAVPPSAIAAFLPPELRSVVRN